MLEVQNIETYYAKVCALHGVSLEVHEGEMVALIGANGAGKSTTLKSICGLRPPKTGRIVFCGKDITRLRAYDIVKSGIALCPEGRHVFPDLTVEENLLMGAFVRQDTRAIRQDMEELHQAFPILKERERQLAGTLSGGQQQMLAIARALMARPRLVLFDEPSLGLAPVIIHEVARMIRQIHKKGVTVLLVEQNARLALALSDRAYVFENGKIAHAGRSGDLLLDPLINKLYLGG